MQTKKRINKEHALYLLEKADLLELGNQAEGTNSGLDVTETNNEGEFKQVIVKKGKIQITKGDKTTEVEVPGIVGSSQSTDNRWDFFQTKKGIVIDKGKEQTFLYNKGTLKKTGDGTQRAYTDGTIDIRTKDERIRIYSDYEKVVKESRDRKETKFVQKGTLVTERSDGTTERTYIDGNVKVKQHGQETKFNTSSKSTTTYFSDPNDLRKKIIEYQDKTRLIVYKDGTTERILPGRKNVDRIIEYPEGSKINKEVIYHDGGTETTYPDGTTVTNFKKDGVIRTTTVDNSGNEWKVYDEKNKNKQRLIFPDEVDKDTNIILRNGNFKKYKGKVQTKFIKENPNVYRAILSDATVIKGFTTEDGKTIEIAKRYPLGKKTAYLVQEGENGEETFLKLATKNLENKTVKIPEEFQKSVKGKTTKFSDLVTEIAQKIKQSPIQQSESPGATSHLQPKFVSRAVLLRKGNMSTQQILSDTQPTESGRRSPSPASETPASEISFMEDNYGKALTFNTEGGKKTKVLSKTSGLLITLDQDGNHVKTVEPREGVKREFDPSGNETKEFTVDNDTIRIIKDHNTGVKTAYQIREGEDAKESLTGFVRKPFYDKKEPIEIRPEFNVGARLQTKSFSSFAKEILKAKQQPRKWTFKQDTEAGTKTLILENEKEKEWTKVLSKEGTLTKFDKNGNVVKKVSPWPGVTRRNILDDGRETKDFIKDMVQIVKDYNTGEKAAHLVTIGEDRKVIFSKPFAVKNLKTKTTQVWDASLKKLRYLTQAEQDKKFSSLARSLAKEVKQHLSKLKA